MIDENDLAHLTPTQKAAILESLYLMVAIDRQLDPEEIKRFDAEVQQIPWQLDTSVLNLVIDKARLRVKSTVQREGWMAWIKEIALSVEAPPLREKVIASMAKLALSVSPNLDPRERGLINAFADAFALKPDAIARLQATFGPQNA